MNIALGSIIAAVSVSALPLPAQASTPDALNGPITSPPSTTDNKSAAEAAEMAAVLQRAKDAVNAAKKPEDLDSIISDLQKYQNSAGPFGFATNPSVAPSNQHLLQQLLSALEFIKQWQNYLSHLNAGDTNQARNDLQMLSQNNFGPTLVPRSRILALLYGQQTPSPASNTPAPASSGADAQKIIDGINTLDDLSTALAKLNTLAADDPFARETAQHLAPMVEVYQDLKNGLPTSVNIDFMGGLTGAGVSVKANALLLKFILQHYFDTYKGAQPGDDETPASYVARVKRDALSGQDWELLKKVLTVHAYLFRDVSRADGLLDNEAGGVSALITGLNQNQAGQYALAVESFQNALDAGTVDIPAKFIGEHLDAIKHDHPHEYDSGMEAYLASTVPPNFSSSFRQLMMIPAVRDVLMSFRRQQAGRMPSMRVISGPTPTPLDFPGTKPAAATSPLPSPSTNPTPVAAP